MDFSFLKNHNKIIVTGCIRSGTTITGYIISKELNYLFVDELNYKSDGDLFFKLLHNVKEKLVIQDTLLLRDLHLLSDYLNENNIAIVYVKRDGKEIMDSIEKSKKFGGREGNQFWSVDKEVLNEYYKYFGFKYIDGSAFPDLINIMFKKHVNKYKYLYYVNYPEDIKDSVYFIKDRSCFQHLKQVTNNPNELGKKIIFVQ